MCKATCLVVDWKGCLLLALRQDAHKCTIWSHQLCADSHNNDPCENLVRVTSTDTPYYVSYLGPCRVCKKEIEAQERCNAAITSAKEQYEILVNEAWGKMNAEMDAALSEVEMVRLFPI